MMPRILTGLILAPLVFALVAIGPLWGTRLFFTLAAMLGAFELTRMVENSDAPEATADRITSVLISGLVVGALSLWGASFAGIIFSLGAMSILLYSLAKPGDMASVGPRMTGMLAGLAYVSTLFGAIVLMTHLPEDWNRWGILICFFAVWPGDTLAFFAGKLIGGRKLYPKVSPKKTWSGAFGGIVGSIAGLFILRLLWIPEDQLSTEMCIFLGAACGVFEQAGDLCESLFKRSYGIKDSGALLPGHGGILDRVDGLIFAGPIVYMTLVLI